MPDNKAMHDKEDSKFSAYFGSLLPAAGLFIVLYLVFLNRESFTAFKVSFIYLLLASAFLFLIITRMSAKLFSFIADTFSMFEDMERLLLDIRDGTKTYYKEKRRFSRIYDRLTAKIVSDDHTDDFIDIVNGSEQGALLKTAKGFEIGAIIELQIYLPLFPQPIDVKAKVIRSETFSKTEPKNFAVGVEFIDFNRIDRQRFLETIDVLKKK